ncbi:hypothetical protein OQH60_05655 [Campylobacter sp. MIT 21-1685]|uniref:hypothetical protein n=1 Tax=unclassified Campylobacter TaxID=2593542 RepID=UPI00224B75EC|nr:MULTISPECIES: hypothetical protein [unclassified Campylobacter]MCX2683313.1 hypothetical protein [Campylobacter sp. MIT 21-1684]MCX2751631.1 hypothetical protein [Campylobacter sp. MIT 21-1682]MCX2807831.1 hypothetical protein [Campylobacter sp. MIT 21-1685]
MNCNLCFSTKTKELFNAKNAFISVALLQQKAFENGRGMSFCKSDLDIKLKR